jgi:hypothetical protein
MIDKYAQHLGFLIVAFRRPRLAYDPLCRSLQHLKTCLTSIPNACSQHVPTPKVKDHVLKFRSRSGYLPAALTKESEDKHSRLDRSGEISTPQVASEGALLNS